MLNPLRNPLKKEYQKIRTFLHEMSDLNGRKQKLMEIFFLLHYAPKVSQKDLQKFTGYSSGTISMALKELQEKSVVGVQLLPETGSNFYFLTDVQLTLDYQRSTTTRSLIAEINVFMQNLLSSLENDKEVNRTLDKATIKNTVTNNPAMKTAVQKDDRIMLENLTDFAYYFSWVTEFKPNIIPSFNLAQIKKNVARPVNPQFSTYFLSIEKNFLNFFVNREIFEEMSPKNSLVLGYFITRSNLTISEIAALVPFSIGTVSKCVHYLEKIHFIQKNPSTVGYTLLSFSIGWLNYRQYYYHRIKIWNAQFETTIKELEANILSFHSDDTFPPFFIFLKKIKLLCEKISENHGKNESVWKTTKQFAEDHPTYFPNYRIY